MRALIFFATLISSSAISQAQDMSSGEFKLPPYYKLKTRCIPEHGYVAIPEAPEHPAALPLVGVFVYRGEVIGVLFEAHERDGWRPWYDEPEGKPVSHDGGPRHYSHTAMFKKGPSAEECKTSKGPMQR